MDLTAEFRAHLQEHWIPFAQSVIDCFLITGFATVDYEQTDIDVGGKRKKNGATVPIGIPASSLVITKLKMDKDRKAALERKKRGGKGGDEPMSNVD